MKTENTKKINAKLIAKLQAAVDAAALEIAQTIENPKTEAIDVNAWYFTAEGEGEKLGYLEIELEAKEGCGISEEEEEIIWKNIPLEMEVFDVDGDYLWWHIKGFGNKPPEDDADLADDRTETLASASPGKWDEKIFDLERFENAIEDAIENGAKKIYIDENCGVWEYEPAEPRVVLLADLEDLASENGCEIDELDEDVVLNNIEQRIETQGI